MLLSDGGFSPEVLEVLEAFVDSKGKAIELAQLQPDADLGSALSYQSASGAALRECLLVVRDAERARVAAQLVTVLLFDDEAELPLLVAARLAASANLEPALGFYLQLRQGIESSVVVKASAERVDFRGMAWRVVTGDELLDLSGVLVRFSVVGFVTLRADGGVVTVTVSEPTVDEVSEARNFVASLVHHGQVFTHIPGQRARGTHEIVTDAHGQRRLVRARSGAR